MRLYCQVMEADRARGTRAYVGPKADVLPSCSIWLRGDYIVNHGFIFVDVDEEVIAELTEDEPGQFELQWDEYTWKPAK